MACNALPELSVAPLGSATNAALALLSADLGSKAAQTAAQAAPEGMQEANCEGLVEPDNLEGPPADEGLAA